MPKVNVLQGRFEELAAREPGRTALVHAPDPGVPRIDLTYGELNRRANRLARRLIELGVGPEQRVAVSVDRTPGMLVALFAILKAGGAYAPLDPAYPRERLALLLEDAHRGLAAPVLLTRRKPVSNLPEPASGTRVLFLEDEDGEGGPDENPESGAGSGNLAYLIFTSGSTGRPKAVAIEHRSAVAMVEWARGVFPPGRWPASSLRRRSTSTCRCSSCSSPCRSAGASSWRQRAGARPDPAAMRSR